METSKEYWESGDMVCVVDGYRYAVTEDGKTVCIGKVKEGVNNERSSM